MTEADQMYRDLHPHAEARLAMFLWSRDYAAQDLGCMGFWDSLDQGRRRYCREALTDTLEAKKEMGRAPE